MRFAYRLTASATSSALPAGSDAAPIINTVFIFPISLGIFYEALTQYLGFPH